MRNLGTNRSLWGLVLVAALLLAVWLTGRALRPPAELRAPDPPVLVDAIAPVPVSPAAGDWRDVRCVMPGGAEGAEVVVVSAESEDATQTARIERGAITLVLPPQVRLMLADVPVFGTVRLDVDLDGGCVATQPTLPDVEIAFDVHLPSGEPAGAEIWGCGLPGFRPIETDPTVRVRQERCELFARSFETRQFSEPVTIDPVDGLIVDLELPYEDAGTAPLWIGVRTDDERPGAVAVFRIAAGSSADGLLAEREEIVAVDGVSTAGLDDFGVERLLSGPAGSEVTLRVTPEGGGSERLVTVRRDFPKR